MDLEVINSPRYAVRLNKNEAVALRLALSQRLATNPNLPEVSNSERRVASAILQAFEQLQLGDIQEV